MLLVAACAAATSVILAASHTAVESHERSIVAALTARTYLKERKRKKRRKFPEQHPGPGIWDDFAALFDSDAPVWSTFQSDDDQEAYNQHL